jgi:hypothetical protein
VELKYRSDGDYEEIDIAEGTEDALNECKANGRNVAIPGTQLPGGKIIWLARMRHAQHTVADDTGGVKQSAYDDAPVNEPAGDSVGFEKSEIEEEQGELDKQS